MLHFRVPRFRRIFDQQFRSRENVVNEHARGAPISLKKGAPTRSKLTKKSKKSRDQKKYLEKQKKNGHFSRQSDSDCLEK